ncbi:MAG: M16 family metallopeptidase, partial [Planctomycetota bacterium]
MRTPLILLAVLLIAVPGAARAGQDIPPHPDKLAYEKLDFKVPDAQKMRVELSTGTVVYVVEDNTLPIVEIEIVIRGGSYVDPAEKEGTAALTGSLMRVGGTASRSPEQVDEELEFLAARTSISFHSLFGNATLSILRKNLDKGLEVFFDVLRNPRFDENKLRILKAQTFEQLKARNDSTASI